MWEQRLIPLSRTRWRSGLMTTWLHVVSGPGSESCRVILSARVNVSSSSSATNQWLQYRLPPPGGGHQQSGAVRAPAQEGRRSASKQAGIFSNCVKTEVRMLVSSEPSRTGRGSVSGGLNLLMISDQCRSSFMFHGLNAEFTTSSKNKKH